MPQELFIADFDISINARTSEIVSAAALIECLRVALHSVKLMCSALIQLDDVCASAVSGGRWRGLAAAAASVPCFFIRISHAALPYIIMQVLELLKVSNKTQYYFNSSLMKSFIANSLVNTPPPPPQFSSHDDGEDIPLPPPSKRRLASVQAQLECSPAIAEKILRLADLRHCDLESFTSDLRRELGLEALLADVQSRDPELKTLSAKKISNISALQKMVFQQLQPLDSILPLLHQRSATASGAYHLIFKYDCFLDLPRGLGCAWQGLTFQIAYATPHSSTIPISVPVWEEVGVGGIYDVAQQVVASPRDSALVRVLMV
jgi:hypothetical protein